MSEHEKRRIAVKPYLPLSEWVVISDEADVDIPCIPLVEYLNSFQGVYTLACCQDEPVIVFTIDETADQHDLFTKLYRLGRPWRFNFRIWVFRDIIRYALELDDVSEWDDINKRLEELNEQKTEDRELGACCLETSQRRKLIKAWVDVTDLFLEGLEEHIDDSKEQ